MPATRSDTPYPKLFSPFRIGSLELPSRITMSAMYTSAGSASGLVTKRQIDYYAARAAGGAALIVTELTAVHPHGFATRLCMRLDDDRLVEGHRRLTDAVHAAGGRIASQLCHQGRKVPSSASGHVPVGPSPTPSFGGETPRPLLRNEIHDLVQSFADAASRAVRAGYDAVELHMAHGYLVHEFLSPISNQRSDEYGGDLDGRLRFALEIVEAVRGAVGQDFPILAKLAVEDGGGIGYPKEEGAAMGRRLERAGVNAITASTGAAHGEELTLVPPMTYPRGFNVRLAEALRQAELGIPVGALGRIPSPADAEAILDEGRADYLALGRAFIADPEWGRKAAEGRNAEITPCIGCLQGCYDRLVSDLPIACMTNPRATREAELPWTHAAASRRVLVVGGGVAGMQAAITAARRGHKVSLWERDDHLGGQWISATMAPGKEEFRNYTGYLAAELGRREVDVALRREATPDAVASEGFDAVIVAAGAAVQTPAIPGDGSVPVFDVRAGFFDAFAAGDVPEDHVVVIGSEPATWEAATWLERMGVRATLLTDRSVVARGAGPVRFRIAEDQLHASNVEVIVRATPREVVNGTLVYDQAGIPGRVEGVSAIVVAGQRAPDASLAGALRERGLPVHVVGDARDPRNAFEAGQEAFEVAYHLA
jgi:2,4-dienoyl-CoA reductase-like NADH-dependent reductase (Old Yellow Enzyme family)/thioredoxin reductase